VLTPRESGDAARDALDALLSVKANVARLRREYQKQFEDDPIGVVERLLRLVPKTVRKTADNAAPVGINLVLTTDVDKPKRKRKK